MRSRYAFLRLEICLDNDQPSMDALLLAPQFRSSLAPGERLLWTGRPEDSLVLRLGDALFIPFLLVWLILGGFVAFFAIQSRSVSAIVWCVLALVAFGAMVGRLITAISWRGNTYYAVTDRSAIIMSGTDVKVLNLQALTDVHLDQEDDGSGTIYFGPPDTSLFVRRPLDGRDVYDSNTPCFSEIDNVADVYNTLMSARDAFDPPSTT